MPPIPASLQKTVNNARLRAASAKLKFGDADAFQKAIKRRVERYFSFTGLSPRDNPQMYLKSTVILGWFAASYIVLVFFCSHWWQALPMAVSLGLAMAAIGFNIQHDGGHKAYSKHKSINKLSALTLDLLGASSYIWDHKHNTVHHTYANIEGHDDDIDAGFFLRLAPHQPRLKMHRLQHYYIWLLYGFLSLKWQLVDDFWNVAAGRIGPHRFARPKGRDLAIFIGGKVAFFFLAFVLPAMFHPIWVSLLFYATASFVNGVLLSIVFQLAHVVEEAEFPLPQPASGRIESPWAVHQVETTVDFARNNPVLTWFLGGLNFQIEHHLFPRISHIHYPRLSRLIEHACEEFGLRYRTHKTFWAGLASHFRWVRRMGRATC